MFLRKSYAGSGLPQGPFWENNLLPLKVGLRWVFVSGLKWTRKSRENHDKKNAFYQRRLHEKAENVLATPPIKDRKQARCCEIACQKSRCSHRNLVLRHLEDSFHDHNGVHPTQICRYWSLQVLCGGQVWWYTLSSSYVEHIPSKNRQLQGNDISSR